MHRETQQLDLAVAASQRVRASRVQGARAAGVEVEFDEQSVHGGVPAIVAPQRLVGERGLLGERTPDPAGVAQRGQGQVAGLRGGGTAASRFEQGASSEPLSDQSNRSLLTWGAGSTRAVSRNCEALTPAGGMSCHCSSAATL